MNTIFSNKEIVLSLVSIILTFAFSYFIKDWLKSYRKPNGKKGGVLSLQTTIAFSIIAVIAMVTKDVMLTALTVILAYFISRNQIENKQSFIYQIIISIIVGLGIPYIIFWIVNEKLSGNNSNYTMIEREYNEPREHNESKDERHEADSSPDLKLETSNKEIDSPINSPIPNNLTEEEQEFLNNLT